MSVRLPNDQNRTTVIGPTGSGKTTFAIWLMSTCATLNWRKYPVIAWDFKGDEILEELLEEGYATEWPVNRDPPKKPGLYIVRPMPHQADEVEAFLWKVWKKGKTGLFFDEGYMVNKSKALNAILTQGRSKRIPVIMCVQRPVWVSRFCFSEAQYFAIFYQTFKPDIDTVQGFVNTDVSQFRGPYHALWYDVGANAGRGAATVFKPVPGVDEIVAAFRPRKTVARKRII